MSLGPQGGRSLLATMWRLAIARQQLLLVALALVLIDASAVAAAIGALGQADTFANFSSAIFDESRTLAAAHSPRRAASRGRHGPRSSASCCSTSAW